MNKLYRLLLLSLVLVLLISGCGGDKDKESDDADSAKSSATSAPEAPTKEAEATKPPQPTNKPDEAQATEPSIATQAAPTDKPAGDSGGGDASRVLKLNALNAKPREFTNTDLQSYRMSLNWETSPKQGGDAQVMEMQIAHTNNPQAEQIELTSSVAGQADVTISIVHIGDKVWMQIGGIWIEATDQDLAGYEHMFDALESAGAGLSGDAMLVGEETINGVATRHYSFDESTPGMEMDIYQKISGDVWVAQDGGYVIKYTFNAEDANALYNWNWEVYDINGDFSIEQPSDAPGAREDVPLMSDATNTVSMEGMITYQSPSSLSAVTEFYQTEMPANGWTYDQTGSMIMAQMAMLNFSKDGDTAVVTLAPDDSGTSVVIQITE